MTVISSTTTPPNAPSPAPATDPSPSPTSLPGGESVADSAPEALAGETHDGAGPDAPASPRADPDVEVAKRFEAAKRREILSRAAERKTKEREASIAAKELEIAERLAELEAALEDPIEWALRKGKDPEKLVSRFLPETPDAKRLRQLEDQYAADKKAAADAAAAERKTREQNAQIEAKHRFLSGINEETHPSVVALYEPEHALVLRDRALAAYGPGFEDEHGRPPTDAEVAALLERQAKSRLEKLRIANAQPAPANDTTVATSQVNAKQASSGSGHQAKNGPGTLTNNHAAQTAAGRTVAKTREERKRDLIEQLEAEAREA